MPERSAVAGPNPQMRRVGWDTFSCATQGIEIVDAAHEQLIIDLEHMEFAPTFRQANLAVPVWASARRRLAVDLARVAMATRDGAVPELPAAVRALDGPALARRFADVTDRLHEALVWVPSERMQHLDPVGRGPAFLEDVELPHIAYLTVTATAASEARGRVQAFVRLVVEATHLERETLSRGLDEFPDGPRAKPEFVPATAAFAVASRHRDETYAMEEVLEKLLPWRRLPAAVGSYAPDRLWDGKQDLREQLLKLLRALGAERSRSELFGLLLDNHPDLRYAPNHAWGDFLNQREKDRQDALGHADDGVLEDSEFESADKLAPGFPNPSFDRPVEPALAEFVRALEHGTEELQRVICRKMQHTEKERRILAAILGDPGGTDVAIAETVGCSREYVNKYRRRLRLTFESLTR